MIRKEIEKALNDAMKKIGLQEKLAASFSSVPNLCDFQCNGCFAIAKQLSLNPYELAQKIVENIEKNDNFTFSCAKPAFINIKLTKTGLSRLAKYYFNNDGVKQVGKKKSLYIDYGGPNIGKAMHIGHMRSFDIGEAFKRLYRALGFNVTSDIFLGDWGMPLGLIMAQLESENTLDGYMSGALDLTLEVMNRSYPAASARKEVDPVFKARAEELTLEFQRKNEPYFGFWKALREVSVSEIKRVCKLLNVEFDLWNGESTANDYIPAIMDILKSKNLLRESGGAIVMDVAEKGEQIPLPKKEGEVQRYENPMPPLILQKRNGGDLYSTSDIASIYLRNLNYRPDIIHYLTDVRQKQHFVQVFRACKKSGISPPTQQLWHTGFGTINGKDGKPLKTRDGGNMQLNDLLSVLYEKAEQKLKANKVNFDEELKRKIGNAALKFADLLSTVEKDVNFDMDKITSFEGKTGPYIQYTACRIKSILSKAPKFNLQFQLDTDEERELILAIAKLYFSFNAAFEARSVSVICNNLFELASKFSSFYNACHILSEKDEVVLNSRLTLLQTTLRAIEKACEILAIEIPDKM